MALIKTREQREVEMLQKVERELERRREFDRIFEKNNLMNCCTVHFLFVSL